MTDSQKDPRVADPVSTEPAESSNNSSIKGSARHMLREFFGFSEFRPGQEAVLEAAARGRDVLAVMPTSGGKSLCYQVPALMAEGLTLVISPLVSLMKDQMDSLRVRIRQSGGRPDTVAALHSGLTIGERRRVEHRLLNGGVKILYVAPERLRSLEVVVMLKRVGVSLVVVDEAHCISEWGHSFRPEYLFLATAVEALGKAGGAKSGRPPVMALTATADERVRKDIVGLLGLREPAVVQTGFDRPNLRYRVRWVAEDANDHTGLLGRLDTIVEALSETEPPAIIYVHTRRRAEEIAADLSGLGIPAEAYHAGMNHVERDRVQGRFMADELPVIVATVAFGMGVDKPNVRTVIHAGVPASIPAYVQEAGRGGRDGRPASSTVLFSPKELERRKDLAGSGQTTAEETRTFFDALRKIAVRETAGVNRGKLRANPKAHELLKLGGVGYEAAQDALRALEELGRVRRHYNVWSEVCVSGLPGLGGAAAGPAEDSAAAVLDALRWLRDESGGSDGFRVALPELAREAGVSPVVAQAAITRLVATGAMRATGRGVLADLLIKTRPLSGWELRKLEKRFEARSAVEVRHLEDVGNYASLRTCRRARLLSYFGDGDAGLVAPCDGCDVCQGGSQGTRTPGWPTASILFRAFAGLRRAVFGAI